MSDIKMEIIEIRLSDVLDLAKERDQLKVQIESLKAITKLAVKELSWYADIGNHLDLVGGSTRAGNDQGMKARSALSEIRVITNAQT